MTFHRFIYKTCWRNKVILPLFMLIITLSVIALVLHDTSVEYAPSGRQRMKYHLISKRVAGDSNPAGITHYKHMLIQGPKLDDQGNSLHEVNLVGDINHPQIVNDEQNLQVLSNITAHSSIPNVQNQMLDEKKSDNNIFEYSQVGLNSSDNKARHSLNKLQASILGHAERNMIMPSKTDKSWIQKKKSKFKSTWKRDLYYNVSNPPELFRTWNIYVDSFCNDHFVGYFNEFVHLKNIVIDKEFIFSERVGGEKLKSVMNQLEDYEYFTYKLGAFEMNCQKRPLYYFNNNNHMNDWLYSLKTRHANKSDVDLVQDEFVIAIVRYEYVNIYHTMSDWYNAFLMMQMFNKTQWETNIVLLDAHPQGALDSTWLVLFNNTQRLTMLPKRKLFTNMVWNILGYNSPMLDHYGPGMPLIEEFREFFLTSFNSNNSSKLDCAELHILFIWRRDYVAHPRNPTGTISRKIYNERELMKSVQGKYPSFHVRGMQIDLFDMQKQLSTIIQTDILIGMHGAGLTHAIFLPKHAAVIEMIPSYWSTANDHFYAISKWRNLIYERWSNEDPQNEAPDNYTKIPLGVMHTLIKSVIRSMCYKRNTSNTI